MTDETSWTLDQVIGALTRYRDKLGGDVRVIVFDTVSDEPNDAFFSNLTDVDYDVFDEDGPSFVVINTRRDDYDGLARS